VHPQWLAFQPDGQSFAASATSPSVDERTS